MAIELDQEARARAIESIQRYFEMNMDDRIGNHHLGVKQRMARHLAMEEPAMPVRPVHHRGDR